MLRELLLDIGNNYLAERESALAGNAFAERVRANGKLALSASVADNNLKYKASVGAGNWAAVPWLGVFNPESTESATHGVYVVYLFSASFDRVFLCQAQGVTKVMEEFGRGQADELKRRAALIRARVPEYEKYFLGGAIELGGDTKLSQGYDSSVAYFKQYTISKLPSNEVLVADLKQAVKLYNLLISRGGVDNLDSFSLAAGENSEEETVVERRRYVRHMKIELNAKAARLAKALHGYTCAGCGLNFTFIYGDVGKDYIEAHHLRPLHLLVEGESVKMDVAQDFAVLCSNCHTIVHRAKPMLTIDELRKLEGVRMLRRAFEQKYGKKS